MSRGIFGTTASPNQSVTLTNTTAQESRIMNITRARATGIANLTLTGENTSGTITGLTVEFRLILNEDENGNMLYGAWQTLSNTFSAPDYQNVGTDWLCDFIDVGADDNYIIADGVQFRATGAGTHVTELSGFFIGS